MPRPDLNTVPEWYHGYIKLVEENNLMVAMKEQTPLLIRFFNRIPPSKEITGMQKASGPSKNCFSI